MNTDFGHLVEVDEAQRKLVIYRLYEDRRRELFTSVDLPTSAAVGSGDEFEKFCRLVGENLLLDSPSARRLLKL